jgi:hypothetical protein
LLLHRGGRLHLLRLSGERGAVRRVSILAAVLGIHEMVVLFMILVAAIGYLIERFGPAPADSEAGEKKSGTPE